MISTNCANPAKLTGCPQGEPPEQGIAGLASMPACGITAHRSSCNWVLTAHHWPVAQANSELDQKALLPLVLDGDHTVGTGQTCREAPLLQKGVPVRQSPVLLAWPFSDRNVPAAVTIGRVLNSGFRLRVPARFKVVKLTFY